MRRTGPGKVRKRANPESLLIFNFDVDGDELKNEHREFLVQNAVPRLKAGEGVVLVGLTDRLGNATYNKALSDRRVNKTIAFLASKVPDFTLLKTSGLGEDEAALQGEADESEDDEFRSVLLFFKKAKPDVVTRSKRVNVTAKSFIATIGSGVGVMPGFTIVPAPPPLPPAVPVPRQTLLNAMAAMLDQMMNEDPTNRAQDKHYRLFTSVDFQIIWEGKNLLATTPTLTSDVGLEGPIQPPAMIVTPVTLGAKDNGKTTFSWFGKGKPDPKAEPGFQLIRSRTSKFIWHNIEGEIDINSGEPVVTARINGSRFPSHRVFVDGHLMFPQQKQNVLANLWDPTAGDPERVQ